MVGGGGGGGAVPPWHMTHLCCMSACIIINVIFIWCIRFQLMLVIRRLSIFHRVSWKRGNESIMYWYWIANSHWQNILILSCRFTEFFVDELQSTSDLTLLVTNYLKDIFPSPSIIGGIIRLVLFIVWLVDNLLHTNFLPGLSWYHNYPWMGMLSCL